MHRRHVRPLSDRIESLKGSHGGTRGASIRTVCLVGSFGIVEIDLRQTDDRVRQTKILDTVTRKGTVSLMLIIIGLRYTIVATFPFLQHGTAWKSSIFIDIE